jgi:hypothetical protein
MKTFEAFAWVSNPIDGPCQKTARVAPLPSVSVPLP